MHTNFDLSSEQLCARLAEKLGAEIRDFAAPRGAGEPPKSVKLGKFVTYVPEAALDKLRDAVCGAGAGRIGDYSHCSFSTQGEGTFLGGKGTNPKVGKAGALERASERRFEVVFPWKELNAVVKAAKAAHPYEEMAYDVMQLAQIERPLGYGFLGELRSGLAFHKLLDNVKETFQLRTVTISGPALADANLQVRKIAFSPGSGSSFVTSVAARGADVYVCGEIGYHQMLEARQKGLSLVVLGHSYSERFFVETVAEWCEAEVPVKKVFETIHDVQ